MSGNISLFFIVLYPMLGSLIVYVIGRYHKNLRDYFMQFICISECILFLCMLVQYLNQPIPLVFHLNDFCGMGLHLKMDGFRVLYGTIAAFMWALTSLLSKQYFGHYHNRNRYYLFFLLTLGATEGVFLSADLYTTFIFFEMMSFTSYVWVVHDEKKESLRAGSTYLAVAVIGGLVMLMGLFLLYDTIGTLTISEIWPAVCSTREELVKLIASSSFVPESEIASGITSMREFHIRLYAAGFCMLFGFGAKAGMFPLHIWLPKAHPVAPAPASALLSGILTKAGIFGILVISCNIFFGDVAWGSVLVILAVFTMVIGAVLAVFSTNLKRTLACSSVSQIGFILTGIGMSVLLGEENVLAVRGALLHMVNHSLIKLVLFMAAGVVFMNIHALDLNEIRGFGHKKPLLHFSFLMGALGIGGAPLWNGYVSKTLIHESILEYIELLKEGSLQTAWFSAGFMKAVEWAFLISGGMTIAYMLKLYICIFIEKNEDAGKQQKYDEMSKSYMTLQSRIAMLLSGIILPIMGFFPQIVMNKMADLGQDIFRLMTEIENVKYFSLANLKGGFISIIIGTLLYFGVIRTLFIRKTEQGKKVYVDLWPKWLDLENMLYRPLLLTILPFLFGVLCRILDSLVDGIVVLLRKTIYKDSPLPHELEEGTPLTHLAGSFMDTLREWKYKLAHKDMPQGPTFEHRLANLHEDLNENITIIGRSMSFGLLLFCIGLMITVAYLIFR